MWVNSKNSTNRTLSLDEKLEISLVALKNSINKYNRQSGFRYLYENIIGNIDSKLIKISLNSYPYYQTFIFKPFLNFSLALLGSFHFDFWIIIIFILLAYHIKDILVGIPTQFLSRISKKIFENNQFLPKTMWIGLYSLMAADKFLKHFMALPVLAILYLLTSGLPEDKLFISYFLVDIFDFEKVMGNIPISDSLPGRFLTFSEASIFIGCSIGILNYLYYLFGFKIIKIRWNVDKCLKDRDCIQKIFERAGSYKNASQLIQYWQYMAYQHSLFQSGKLIVEDGLSLNKYMFTRSWKPVLKGAAIALLPMPISLYYLWDAIINFSKIIKTYSLFRRRLGPLGELIV